MNKKRSTNLTMIFTFSLLCAACQKQQPTEKLADNPTALPIAISVLEIMPDSITRIAKKHGYHSFPGGNYAESIDLNGDGIKNYFFFTGNPDGPDIEKCNNGMIVESKPPKYFPICSNDSTTYFFVSNTQYYIVRRPAGKFEYWELDVPDNTWNVNTYTLDSKSGKYIQTGVINRHEQTPPKEISDKIEREKKQYDEAVASASKSSSQKVWYSPDSTFSECIVSKQGPAGKLDEISAYAGHTKANETHDQSGSLTSVEIRLDDGDTTHIWDYYHSKADCESKELNNASALADKYR